jgi:hypothetical protein
MHCSGAFETRDRKITPVVLENLIRADSRHGGRISASFDVMLAIFHLLAMFVADLFKSRRRLEAQNLFLRSNIALRRAPSSAAGPVICLLPVRISRRHCHRECRSRQCRGRGRLIVPRTVDRYSQSDDTR